MAHLAHDFGLQVPRQDEQIVGPCLIDGLDRMDGNVHAGREAAVLIRIAIDREVEEILADAAIVEQRVALPGRAVAADPLALSLQVDQRGEQIAFHGFNAAGEAS